MCSEHPLWIALTHISVARSICDRPHTNPYRIPTWLRHRQTLHSHCSVEATAEHISKVVSWKFANLVIFFFVTKHGFSFFFKSAQLEHNIEKLIKTVSAASCIGCCTSTFISLRHFQLLSAFLNSWQKGRWRSDENVSLPAWCWLQNLWRNPLCILRLNYVKLSLDGFSQEHLISHVPIFSIYKNIATKEFACVSYQSPLEPF